MTEATKFSVWVRNNKTILPISWGKIPMFEHSLNNKKKTRLRSKFHVCVNKNDLTEQNNFLIMTYFNHSIKKATLLVSLRKTPFYFFNQS